MSHRFVRRFKTVGVYNTCDFGTTERDVTLMTVWMVCLEGRDPGMLSCGSIWWP